MSLGHNSCTFIDMTPASFTYCMNDLILIYMNSEPVSISKVVRVKLRELLLLYSPGLFVRLQKTKNPDALYINRCRLCKKIFLFTLRMSFWWENWKLGAMFGKDRFWLSPWVCVYGRKKKNCKWLVTGTRVLHNKFHSCICGTRRRKKESKRCDAPPTVLQVVLACAF